MLIANRQSSIVNFLIIGGYVKMGAMQTDQLVLNNRYKLLQRVGSGGMAAVYKAQDLSLGRLVAVKILHESLTDDAVFLRRFQEEAHAAANLSHPNIVTVHDIGQDNSRSYIVMEFVDGQTLKGMIREVKEKSGRGLSIPQTVDLAIQICAGIGYAHRAGLVHCDVKPQNVLITRDNRVKVADFGIARAVNQSEHSSSMMWGTPHYFAPEQAAGQAATPASDVYAIGIIIFEMLTGRLPFESDTLAGLVLKHLHESPPLISQINATVPPQLEQIINKVLSKEPVGRYRTAGQLEQILRAYQESGRQETGVFMAENPPPAEQKTEIYQRPVDPPTVPVMHPAGTHPQQNSSPQPTRRVVQPARQENVVDWTAITLGLITLTSLLGLILVWYFAYRAWAG